MEAETHRDHRLKIVQQRDKVMLEVREHSD